VIGDDMTDEQITELIQRRRLQILVHSYIYYELDNNLIDDDTFTKWTYELVELQNKYPKIADKCCYAKEFKGYKGASGLGLPYNDERIVNKALQLIRYADSQKK
jgi:hypothetical protein